MCSSIVLKEKLTVGSPFFGAFPTDRIPKATKDVNVRKFLDSQFYLNGDWNFSDADISVNYTSEFRKLSEATMQNVLYTYKVTVRDVCVGGKAVSVK
jgi:hypothetical protein